MPKVPLAGMTLAMLGDGYAGSAIDAALKNLQQDIVQRGSDGLARVLTVKVTFTPDDKLRCKIEVDVGTKIPGFKPPATMAKYDQNAGGLMFSPDCSENPDQTTINDLNASE